MAAGIARVGGVGPDPPEVSFRKLRAADLPLLHRSRNNLHVVRWWYGEGNTYPETEQRNLPRIGGKSRSSRA